MNKYVKMTSIFIAVSVIIWIAYDAWAITMHGKDASISQVLIDYFYAYPIGGIALGIVIGHIGWRMPDRFPISKEEIEIIKKIRGEK
jgi:NhaP-type Na+/H+ or K+/H+ antiporter